MNIYVDENIPLMTVKALSGKKGMWFMTTEGHRLKVFQTENCGN